MQRDHAMMNQMYGFRVTENDALMSRIERERVNGVRDMEKVSREIRKLLKRMMPFFTKEKMDKATVTQLGIAVGTLIDKYRLLNGESTQNISVVHRTRGDMLRDLGIVDGRKKTAVDDLTTALQMDGGASQ